VAYCGSTMDDLVQSEGSSIPTYGSLRPTLVAPLQVNHTSEQSMLNNYFLNACDDGNTCADGSTGGQSGSALLVTPSYTLGNAPRTYGGVRQPGAKVASMTLFKEFPMASIREGMRMEFRLEAFNVFNHPSLAASTRGWATGRFGTITSSVDGSQRQLVQFCAPPPVNSLTSIQASEVVRWRRESIPGCLRSVSQSAHSF
jgi:hypothetical protein